LLSENEADTLKSEIHNLNLISAKENISVDELKNQLLANI
jgi:hypothetical protein